MNKNGRIYSSSTESLMESFPVAFPRRTLRRAVRSLLDHCWIATSFKSAFLSGYRGSIFRGSIAILTNVRIPERDRAYSASRHATHELP